MINRHDSAVVQNVSRFLGPFIQVFAVYVLAHGHYSPGGGFQAGVLLGAAIILELLVGTKQELKRFSTNREFLVAAAGVGIFLMIGAAALIHGGQLFNYGVLSWLAEHEARRRYWSILIAEIGVTLAVSMTLVVIFHVLAFLPAGKED